MIEEEDVVLEEKESMEEAMKSQGSVAPSGLRDHATRTCTLTQWGRGESGSHSDSRTAQSSTFPQERIVVCQSYFPTV